MGKKARESGGDPADKPLDPSERAELERLRAENAELARGQVRLHNVARDRFSS